MTTPNSPEGGSFTPQRHNANVNKWARSIGRDYRKSQASLESEINRRARVLAEQQRNPELYEAEVERRVQQRIKELSTETRDKGELREHFASHLFALHVRADQIIHKAVGKAEGFDVRTKKKLIGKDEPVGASWRSAITTDNVRVNYDFDMNFKDEEVEKFQMKFKSDDESRTAPSTDLTVGRHNGSVSFSLSWQGGDYTDTLVHLLGSEQHPLILELEKADTHFFKDTADIRTMTITLDAHNLDNIARAKVSFGHGEEIVELDYDGATDTFGEGNDWTIATKRIQDMTASLVNFIPTKISPYPKKHEFEEDRYYRELLMPGEYQMEGKGLTELGEKADLSREGKFKQEIKAIVGALGKKLFKVNREYFEGEEGRYDGNSFEDIRYSILVRKPDHAVQVMFGDAYLRSDIYKNVSYNLDPNGNLHSIDFIWNTHNPDRVPDILRSDMFPHLREISQARIFKPTASNMIRVVLADGENKLPKIFLTQYPAFVYPSDLLKEEMTEIPFDSESMTFSNDELEGFPPIKAAEFLHFLAEFRDMVPVEALKKVTDIKTRYTSNHEISQYNIPRVDRDGRIIKDVHQKPLKGNELAIQNVKDAVKKRRDSRR